MSIEGKKIEFENWKLWISASWYLIKANYPIAIGITFLSILMGIVTSKVPFVGSIAGSFLLALIAAGNLSLTKKWIDGKKPAFSHIFVVFQDRKLFDRLFPFFILNAVLAVPGIFLLSLSPGNIFGFMGFIGMSVSLSLWALQYLLLAYTLPIMLFDKTKLVDTIPMCISATIKNLGLIIVFAVAFFLMMIVLAIPLGIPALFIVAPMYVVLPYIIYASLFKELDVKNLIVRLKKEDFSAPEIEAGSPETIV